MYPNDINILLSLNLAIVVKKRRNQYTQNSILMNWIEPLYWNSIWKPGKWDPDEKQIIIIIPIPRIKRKIDGVREL